MTSPTSLASLAAQKLQEDIQKKKSIDETKQEDQIKRVRSLYRQISVMCERAEQEPKEGN